MRTFFSFLLIFSIVTSVSAAPKKWWYQDFDGDFYGNVHVKLHKKLQPVGYVADSTDCNDSLATIYPGATELCNGLDDNCNGKADDGIPFYTYYIDANEDGYGDDNTSAYLSCLPTTPIGYVTVPTPDCDITIVNTGNTIIQELFGLGGEFFVDAKNIYQDMFLNPYNQRLSDLGAKDILHHEGALSHWWNVKFPDDTMINGPTKAYGFFGCDYSGTCKKNPPQYDATCMQDGIGCATYSVNFDAVLTTELLKIGQKKLALYYPIQQSNAYDAFLAYCKWLQGKGFSIKIVFGDEYNLADNYNNKKLFPNGGVDYANFVKPLISKFHSDLPGVKLYGDGAPVQSKGNKDWNNAVQGMDLDGVNIYIEDEDLYDLDGVPQTNYVDSVKNAATKKLTDRLDLFFSVFSGKECMITAWGTVGGKLALGGKSIPPLTYDKTALGGEYLTWFLGTLLNYNYSHTNKVTAAYYYRASSSGIWDPAPNWNYEGLYANKNLFSDGSTYCTFTTSITGITGSATVNASGYNIVIVNETGKSIPLNLIKCDGFVNQITSVWNVAGTSQLSTGYNIGIPALGAFVMTPYSIGSFEVSTPIKSN